MQLKHYENLFHAGKIQFQELPIECREKPHIAEIGLIRNASNLMYIGDSLFSDKDFILNIFSKKTFRINYADSLFSLLHDNLKSDYQFIESILKQNNTIIKCLEYNENFWNDSNLWGISLEIDGLLLKYAPVSISSNKDIVLKAVKNNPFSYQFIDKSLYLDQKLAIFALKENCTILPLLHKELIENIDFINSLDENFYKNISKKLSPDIYSCLEIIASITANTQRKEELKKSLKDKENLLYKSKVKI